MKRAGEAVMILRVLISAGGAQWLRYFVFSAWAFGVCVLAIVIGFGIIALGGGLLKPARFRESKGATAS
jgi:hypothetical protein